MNYLRNGKDKTQCSLRTGFQKYLSPDEERLVPWQIVKVWAWQGRITEGFLGIA